MEIHTPRIKVCCIQSPSEAKLVFKLGVDAIGLVSEMPSGPGIIPPERILEITRLIPPSIDGFVLTRLTNSWDLIDLIRSVKNRTIQLVDKLGAGNYMEIRSSIPCVKIVQVVHVNNEDAIDIALKVDPFVDAILLDSGNPEALVPEFGGTGRVHDWSISREIVKHVESPVFLAGGLNPDNIAEAISIVNPFGVDVCNGVRTDGKLDLEKLNQFVSNVRNWNKG